MAETTKLQAPPGVTSASAEGQQYDVGADGTVEVDSDHVAALKGHGFSEYVPPAKSRGKKDSEGEGQ